MTSEREQEIRHFVDLAASMLLDFLDAYDEIRIARSEKRRLRRVK